MTTTHPNAPSHFVQFYDDELDLTDRVGHYLARALERGETAIVIASVDHIDTFEASMGAAGADVEAAKSNGHLVVLDAEEVLSRFIGADGSPDPAAFDAVIGGLVRGSARPVSAYGEMVAILWERGAVPAAIALEELWNDLQSTLSFSLFCAYPTAIISEADADALDTVCALHNDSLGAGLFTTKHKHFSGGSSAPTAARHFTVDALQAAGLSDVINDAAVVVTELATNAVKHARSGFLLTITPIQHGVRIAVRDYSEAQPTVGAASSLSRSGRGLFLVEALATRWGSEQVRDGKVVWAEVECA